MLHKTQGIVLNYMRYRDTSIIVKIYTEKFGIQSYIENGIRSIRSKNKIALFQPMTLLDLVVYHDERKPIQRIAEVRCLQPFKSLPYDIGKSSIALFLIEILGKTLKEEEENQSLFGFLQQSILVLDELERFENFHLIFLLQLSFFLGFSPHEAAEISNQFQENNIGLAVTEVDELALNQLIEATYGSELNLNRTHRNHLLDVIIIYYRLHIENFGNIKSLQVLKEVSRA
jgi:DNA repair protein RecO (recombination protein O)